MGALAVPSAILLVVSGVVVGALWLLIDLEVPLIARRTVLTWQTLRALHDIDLLADRAEASIARIREGNRS